MEDGDIGQIKLHERADRGHRQGWQDCRDQPPCRQLSGQSGRSPILLYSGGRQDRLFGDHPVSLDLELEGRRALVTGGTRGVGAAVVEMLRTQGAKVITTARSVPDSAADGVDYIAADITTAAGCVAVARAVLDRLGGIDIPLNLLGGSSAPGGGFALLDAEERAKSINLHPMPPVPPCRRP